MIANVASDTVQSKLQLGYSGYPVSHIKFLRCRSDMGELQVGGAFSESPEFITEGLLRCCSCGQEYPIIDGIVQMLEQRELDAEGIHELRFRDELNAVNPNFPNTPAVEYWNNLEMEPTLAALNLQEEAVFLELACGTGRYTTKLIGRCRALVAVDFSLVSLRALAERIPKGAKIGLVQADITMMAVAPRSFDRILSTTCLDSREQRMAMHHLAAEALTEEGLYVFGNEYYNLQTRLLGLPRVQRYTHGGMLYCHLEKDDVLRETAPFFRRVTARPIQVPIPFTRHLAYKWKKAIARIAERIPLICDLGALLLVTAGMPIRQPVEGQHSAGNKFAMTIYRWYRNRQRKDS